MMPGQSFGTGLHTHQQGNGGLPGGRHNRGFTLIQLLVVIAILAALLLPALPSAKRKAIDLGCLSKSKQMLLSTKLYVDEANGAMINWDDTGHNLWIARLQVDYGALQGVRCCTATPPPIPARLWKQPLDEAPGMTGYAGTADYPWRWLGYASLYFGSYAINAWCYSDDDQVWGADPQQIYHKESDVRRTSQTPYFADSI